MMSWEQDMMTKQPDKLTESLLMNENWSAPAMKILVKGQIVLVVARNGGYLIE